MTTEQKRKELNKKLVKTTFSSEMKSKKKQFNAKRFILDFIMLIIAMTIADMICQAQDIKGGVLYAVICICMMVIMLGASAALNNKLFHREKKEDK